MSKTFRSTFGLRWEFESHHRGRRMRQSGWVVFLVILACMPLFWPPEACSANDAEVLAPGVDFPEGTIFLGDTLYFVDYAGSSVLKLASAGQELVWHETGCGPAGLLARPEGLLVACYDGNHVVLISLDGKVLKRIDQDVDGRGFAGPNDLAADAKGGVYFSASGSNRSGKVYYYGSDGRAKPVASDIDYANGLVLSPDGSRLYVAESEAHRLLYALVAADGSVGPLHEFVNLDALLAKGRSYVPDGVRVDAQGRLFVGLWDGGGFAVIGADAKLIAQVDVAGEHHANLAISPDGRFIFGTTVSGEGSERHGAIYKVPNPVFK